MNVIVLLLVMVLTLHVIELFFVIAIYQQVRPQILRFKGAKQSTIGPPPGTPLPPRSPAEQSDADKAKLEGIRTQVDRDYPELDAIRRQRLAHEIFAKGKALMPRGG